MPIAVAAPGGDESTTSPLKPASILPAVNATVRATTPASLPHHISAGQSPHPEVAPHTQQHGRTLDRTGAYKLACPAVAQRNFNTVYGRLPAA